MPQLYRTIVQPVVTEKSSAAFETAKVYTFKVHTKAYKPEIRDAIEHLFGDTVTAVRTVQMRAEARKAGGMGRGREGRREVWKKALVVLKDGDVIPIFEG